MGGAQVVKIMLLLLILTWKMQLAFLPMGEPNSGILIFTNAQSEYYIECQRFK